MERCHAHDKLLFKNFEPIMKWFKLHIASVKKSIERMAIGTESQSLESKSSAREGCTNLLLFVKGTVLNALISH